MAENHKSVDQFNHLVNPLCKEITLTTHARLTKIQKNNGITLWGILMDKSIILPFTAGPDTEETIKNLVSLNLMDLDRELNEPHARAACRTLGLCFNGDNEGFYSDGTALKESNIMVLHIYPRGLVETQDEFVKKISDLFLSRGCTMTIEKKLLKI